MAAMKIPFTLGVVGHFGLAVRAPKKSAKLLRLNADYSMKSAFIHASIGSERDRTWPNGPSRR
jgi:hypothetical protein